MPSHHAPPPLAPPASEPGAWRVVACGALGVAAVLTPAALGRADPLVAVAAAAVVTAGAGLLARSASRRSSDPVAEAPRNTPETPPYVEALEALPDPFMIVSAGEVDDQAGRRIAFANAAARELLRTPREGGLLVAAVRRPEVLEAVDESLYGRVPGQTAFEAGGAQERFWRAWTMPLGGGGDRRFAVLLLRDETDARRAERTRVDFLANASHELRTPLASLSGFIETLRGHAREDTSARERFLDIMAAQTDRMARLTEDLLSLSRVELNEHVPPTGACDLAQVTADVVAALQPLTRQSGVEIALIAPPGDAVIPGERDQLVQVAQNLIHNALKYSSTGGRVEVEILVDAAADDAIAAGAPGLARAALLTPDRSPGVRYVALRVADQGPGMEREHLPRLSERFYRVEGQKSGTRTGTGLGLAIVKHIINRHRGGLVVESAPGRGARFTAYFPKADEPRP